jgi:dipeptidyl aminopeptidase/acylaminoacyl peptidase
MVKRYPVVNWLEPIPGVDWIPYPYAHLGDSIRQSELFIIDVDSKKQTRVDVGEDTDQYLYVIGWRIDGSELLYLRLSRDFKKLDVMAANPSTGSTRCILTETSDTFIIGEQLPYTWPQLFTLLKDNDRFIWRSEKDGWNHLYLYNLEGTLIRRLTRGNYPLIRVISVDEQNGWIYFRAHSDQLRPYDIHLCRVNLEGEGFEQLTNETGEHGCRFSPSKEYFLDYHSSIDRPNRVDLKRVDGQLVMTVEQTRIDRLQELHWIPPEEFIVKARDNKTDLHGLLFKPFDFDPQKRYPIIEYIYMLVHKKR